MWPVLGFFKCSFHFKLFKKLRLDLTNSRQLIFSVSSQTLFLKSLLPLLCLKLSRLLILLSKSQRLGVLNTVLCYDFSYSSFLAHSKLTGFLAVPPLFQGKKLSSRPFCLPSPLREVPFPYLTNSPPSLRSLLKYHLLRESLSEDLIATPTIWCLPFLLCCSP